MNDPELDLMLFETGARKPVAPVRRQPTTWAEALVNLKDAAARGDDGARKALVALGEA